MQLEFELVFYDVIVQYLNHNSTEIPPGIVITLNIY